MSTAQSLTFQWTTCGVAIGILLLAATGVLCFLGWSRSGFQIGTGVQELLRFVIVLLVVVTLMQPEWLTVYRPTEKPTVLVLTDVSKSMETRDVIDDSQTSTAAKTRTESIHPLVEAPLWEPLKERFQVVFEPFSSTLPEPAEGTNLSAALLESLRQHGNLAAVVLGSDGDWNTGDPPARAAGQLRAKEIPVFAVAAGSESRLPDLDLMRVDAPTFGVLGKPLRIPYVIESSLPRETSASVTLTPSKGKPITSTVKIPAMSQVADSILWTPHEKGDFELKVNLPVDRQESVTTNNERVVPISIREEELKVLLVESYPRWEYRYLRNALERDPGVEVSCVLYHPGLSKVGGGRGYLQTFPRTMEELSKYDVVFLGDVGVEPGQLTLEDCRLIKALINSHASGLVWMPGMRGAHLSFIGTELEELYPVVLDPAQPRGWGSRVAANVELTTAGRLSLLTHLEDSDEANAKLWESLPGFQWYAAVSRARAGSEVLATHRSETTPFGRLPLLVTKTYGTGKVLFIGTDGAWRWREGVEDKYHYRFWGQVARWMAYQRSMAQGATMRLFFSPDRPRSGDLVTLNANVMGKTGEPLQAGAVIVQIASPSGQTETVRLSSADEWGLFNSTFTPRESGQYQLQLTSPESNSTLETTLSVQNVQRERLGQPARFDVLTEIAAMTGGRLVKPSGIQQLLENMDKLPQPDPIVKRFRIWCHPAWAGLVVVLLGAFWTIRKIAGVI